LASGGMENARTERVPPTATSKGSSADLRSGSHDSRRRKSPAAPTLNVDNAHRPSTLPARMNDASQNGTEDAIRLPPRTHRRDEEDANENTGLTEVRGPTAFDEVRYELIPLDGAPKLSRPAMRTSGKVSMALLAKYICSVLGLDASISVKLCCSGEDLSDAITLNHLVTHVWPESEGHVVLGYRIG